MTNIKASEFVNRVKQLVANYELMPEQLYLNEILIPETKKYNTNLTGEFLFDLYNNYDLKGRTIGFDFLDKLNENSDFIFFAMQDPFEIAINKKTNEVIMYDSEFCRIYLKLAKNINEFIKITLLIFEYSLSGWIFEKEYTKDDRFTLFKKIEDIVDTEYITYYKQTYAN